MRTIIPVILMVMFVPFASAQGAMKINSDEARTILEKNKTAVLLDVRTAEEFAQGHIKGAVLLPYDAITGESAARIIPSKDTQVVLYCRSGRRSALAGQTLLGLGYTKVHDLGGINMWPFGLIK